MTTIPKIIHQIWIQGESEIPEELKEFHVECKEVNNDFQVLLWDDRQIVELLTTQFGEDYTNLYNSYPKAAQQADFARYAILYTYGGVYLDIDNVCRKNLSELLDTPFFISGPDDSLILKKSYNNHIIGSVPRHPVFEIVFNKMFERQDKSRDVLYSTGPVLMYDAIKEYSMKVSGIKILDKKYLNPCAIYSEQDCERTCEDCYIAHTSNVSWSKRLKFAKWFFANIALVSVLTVALLALIVMVIYFAVCK